MSTLPIEDKADPEGERGEVKHELGLQLKGAQQREDRGVDEREDEERRVKK